MNQRETIHERISETRKDKGLSQKGLCRIAGITTTQLSRIENGITENVSSDVLIKLAMALDVSTDYLLCLTEISSPKNYEIGQLGLSEGAVKSIVSGKANVNSLNALLENAKFGEVLRLTYDYFMGTISEGIMARNEVINLATSTLADFAIENPKHKAEAIKDIRTMKSHKLGKHEAEIEKIKTVFVAMLIEIKKEIEQSTEKKQNVNAEMFKQIISEVKAQKPKSIEEVTEIVANMVQQATQLGGERMAEFKQLSERIMVEYSAE